MTLTGKNLKKVEEESDTDESKSECTDERIDTDNKSEESGCTDDISLAGSNNEESGCTDTKDEGYIQLVDLRDDLLTGINAIRQAGVDFDVAFEVDGTIFNGHRFILRAAMPDYFNGRVDFEEKTGRIDKIIRIGNGKNNPVTALAMAAIMDYVYTGQLKLTVANAADVMMACSYFLLLKQLPICADFLIAHVMNADNVEKLREMFTKLELKDHMSKADEFIKLIDVAPIELEMETCYIRCTSPTVGYLSDMWCCIDPILSPVRSCIKVRNQTECFIKLNAYENGAISFISPKRDGRWFLKVYEKDGHLHWISTGEDEKDHDFYSEIARFKLFPVANSKNSIAPSTVIAEKEDSKEQQIVRAVIRCEENGMFVRVKLDEQKEFYVFANEPDYFKGTEFIIEPSAKVLRQMQERCPPGAYHIRRKDDDNCYLDVEPNGEIVVSDDETKKGHFELSYNDDECGPITVTLSYPGKGHLRWSQDFPSERLRFESCYNDENSEFELVLLVEEGGTSSSLKADGVRSINARLAVFVETDDEWGHNADWKYVSVDSCGGGLEEHADDSTVLCFEPIKEQSKTEETQFPEQSKTEEVQVKRRRLR